MTGATEPPSEAPPPAAALRETITIILADDHEVVRAGLRMLLDAEAGLQVVSEAGTVAETEARVAAHRPAVLILDVNMPDGSSIPAIPGLLDSAPDTHIVVLTMQSDPEVAREALRAGATGFVLKEAAEAELIQAVRLAADGRTYLNPELGAKLAAQAPPEHRSAGRPQRPRARGPEADRARPHQRRDRRPAVPERAHGRVPPGPHPAEDPARLTGRAGGLRARARPAGVRRPARERGLSG